MILYCTYGTVGSQVLVIVVVMVVVSARSAVSDNSLILALFLSLSLQRVFLPRCFMRVSV